jgi:hypothetical protein
MTRRNRFYLRLSAHRLGRIVLHLLALRASHDRRVHLLGIARELSIGFRCRNSRRPRLGSPTSAS